LREHRLDLEALDFWFARNYVVKGGERIDKKPKTGKGRHVSADPLTCELLGDYLTRRRVAMTALGVEVPRDAYVSSPDPAGAAPWNPDTMTHRYRKYADRVGIASSLKETRHYSATQLLTAGVDLKTVAGRLGHAEASTTLRFYAQFARPADQRAATVIPTQLDTLRKRERLRELYRNHQSDTEDLTTLAAVLAPLAGLEPETALPILASFAAEGAQRAG
jgi:integrase